MSNVETRPQEETLCPPDTAPAPGEVEVLEPRDVPLGGPRAMTVRRTLPQRQRSLIGAWCFADHYGPDDVSTTGGMDVPPHPHTGLQTVSWLFTGEVEHRDSLGSHAMVRPGELNLMTGGSGIAHSEVSTPDTTTLHGVQLWVALPDAHRNAPGAFQHHVPAPVEVADGVTASVFLGDLAGQTSPVQTFTPLLGAELTLAPGATATLDVDSTFEHGVLADTEGLSVEGAGLARGSLAYLATGRSALTMANDSGDPARAILLGAPRSRRRSSCGGTSSAAATKRSWLLATRGWLTTSASGKCMGMPVPSSTCRLQSSPGCGSSLVATLLGRTEARERGVRQTPPGALGGLPHGRSARLPT